jgi:hypothetical protein
MELSFPRMKAFYERHGEEVELEAGAIVNADDGEARGHAPDAHRCSTATLQAGRASRLDGI